MIYNWSVSFFPVISTINLIKREGENVITLYQMLGHVMFLIQDNDVNSGKIATDILV